MAIGLAAASTLAALTDGIYLDPQEETILEGLVALRWRKANWRTCSSDAEPWSANNRSGQQVTGVHPGEP